MAELGTVRFGNGRAPQGVRSPDGDGVNGCELRHLPAHLVAIRRFFTHAGLKERGANRSWLAPLSLGDAGLEPAAFRM